MPRCFVIQPFNDEFDELFEQVFAPAIRTAGMEPYRVDRHPAVNLPVENIEAGIRDSDACLADISTDNPNVWYELGFSLACGKDVVIVCSERRPHPLPFDVQHRNIVRYCADRDGDSEQLRDAITERLRGVSQTRSRLCRLVDLGPDAEIGGLQPNEVAALVSIAANRLTYDATVHPSQMRHDLSAVGYDELSIVLAVDALRRKLLVREVPEHDARGQEYTAYQLTDSGADWLHQHHGEIERAA